jgi:hypothetical protein
MREALSRSRWLATTAAIRIRQSEAALHRCGLRCTVRFDESPSRAGTVSLFRRHRRSVGACLQPSLSLLSASSSCFAFKELGSFGHGERRPVTIGTHQLALPTLIDLQVTRDRPEGWNKEKRRRCAARRRRSASAGTCRGASQTTANGQRTPHRRQARARRSTAQTAGSGSQRQRRPRRGTLHHVGGGGWLGRRAVINYR